VPLDGASLSRLRDLATTLRIDSVRSTSEAGSGHPTSCCSAADIVATLFFGEMRFDPHDPGHPENDRFVLSKGHAAPLLYAAWAAAGAFERDELLRLRQLGSDLEGHPTPRLPFVDIATGSLGQGICGGVGLALNARRIDSPYRTYVLLGDGETAEGSVWEASAAAVHHQLDNLCAIVDVNGLGQSRATQLGHDVDAMVARWRGFGWHGLVVDGHDIGALIAAYDEARRTRGRPTVVVARTVKGKGVSLFEGKDAWHGKALKKGAELETALAELQAQLTGPVPVPQIPAPPPRRAAATPVDLRDAPPPAYRPGELVATREAYGRALAAFGALDTRIVALDADVKNSTFSELFEKAHPGRFYEFFIAEQAMVGAAMGLASQGAVPFPSTFACFLSRAYDFIRMAGISGLDLKLAGSHVGVSIGEDGPSQMGLEDLAMMRAIPNCTVLCPCDAVSTERLIAETIRTKGLAYIRTARPKTPVIYGAADKFPIGGSKVLRRSDDDVVAVVATGVTVFEALGAADELAKEGIRIRVIDAYSIQPIDAATLQAAARECARGLVTVEDHYAQGGLGDAVAEAVSESGAPVRRIAVREIPRSGRPEELIDRYGISAARIVSTVQAVHRSAPEHVRAGR
jgi:transketolase